MHFSKLLPLSLLGFAAAAPMVEEADPEFERAMEFVKRQYPVMACSHQTGGIHVLALGGANTNNPKDYGLLGSLAGKILYAIPGSTNVSVPYNKVFASTTPPTLQPNAISDGMKTLKAYTVQYHNACPNTKIAIIGYSSGGVIMMNDLCYGGNGQGTPQINPLLASKTIFGIVAYGEETRAGGESFNVGTCPQQYSATHPRANPSLCAPFANIIRSYCDTGDPDCCVGSPNPNVAIHLSYPTTYDVAATQYIVDQLKAAGGA